MYLILPKFSCRPWWTPSDLDRQSGESGSFRSFLCFRLGIRSCQVFSVYPKPSFPFSFKRYRKTNRQDLVFVRPPDAGKDFRVSINTLIPCGIAAFFSCFPLIPAQTLELSATTARLYPCCGSMMQLHPVLNDAKFF